MFCKYCLGKIDNCVNGTEKIEVCSDCGIVIEDSIIPDDTNLLFTTDHSHLFFTPKQEPFLAKIDGLIDKLCMFATKQRCYDFIKDVFTFRKYRRLSRVKLAAACFLIVAREDKYSISLKFISLHLGSCPNEIGRLVMRISKDFKIQTYFPTNKNLFAEVISKYFNSSPNANLFEDVLSMSIDLYDFSCSLFSFRSLSPLIYGAIYLSLSFHLRDSAPNLLTICTLCSQNKNTVQRALSQLKLATIQATLNLPVILNRKNFISKIPDILRYKSAILHYSKIHITQKDIPEILKQSDPSHPIHDKVPKAFLSDENLSNISDSEVENSLLTIQEVQQKIALYCTQTQMTIADLTY